LTDNTCISKIADCERWVQIRRHAGAEVGKDVAIGLLDAAVPRIPGDILESEIPPKEKPRS
jgi:hypothetical protein